jgi:paraquat-inducible protein B
MSKTPTEVSIEPSRKPFLRGASFVWLIPILALLIALGVAWKSYDDLGPLIEVEFENGAGITKRETELRYRDIPVGVVEDVRFSSDLTSVVAKIRLDKDVAPFVDQDAQFWIVQAELSARGVTGLDTVLSGVYIEGTWDNEIGKAAERFQSLNEAPIYQHGEEGLKISLRSTRGGSLTDHSPITFRGIEVGRVGKARISEQGNYATAEAIIYHPHSRLVSSTTRFWDTSGFTFTVGPRGAEIDFSSLATLLGGGLTFDTFASGGESVSNDTEFDVYPEEGAARNSLFNGSAVEALQVQVVFDENISGLAVDAPVELSGLRIGKVESLAGVVEMDPFGVSRVQLNAVLSIQPARLGLPDAVTSDAALTFLTTRIREGLRARLASTSLLTGGLKIELVQVDDAPPFTLVTGEGIIPKIPTTESTVSDAAATVEGVITRINNLPIEELMISAIQLFDSAELLVSDDDLRETPQDLRALLTDVRTIVASDDVQALPVTLNAAIGRFEALLLQLEKEQLATKLASAVDAAALAAQGVSSSVEGVPALIAQVQGVAAKAEALPLDDLITELSSLSKSADAILTTEAAQKLPADLGAALNEINATLAELRSGGAVTNINATLNSTRKAADAVATSTQDLPALVERIGAVLNQASTTIAGYNQGDTISRSTQTALRDISKAAEAITSLARMLERNPSALIRGR